MDNDEKCNKEHFWCNLDHYFSVNYVTSLLPYLFHFLDPRSASVANTPYSDKYGYISKCPILYTCIDNVVPRWGLPQYVAVCEYNCVNFVKR